MMAIYDRIDGGILRASYNFGQCHLVQQNYLGA